MDKHDELLAGIKSNILEIEKMSSIYKEYEEDFVYRFYHQSFKVFYVINLIKNTKILFETVAPNGVHLNPWYLKIAEKVLEKEFDPKKTNPNWLSETRPLLEAFWHSKYFLDQLARFGRELTECPRMMPSGWASILYLYNLRY